jgi:hypothetical protein
MEVIQLDHMEYESNPQVKVLIDKSEMQVSKARQIMDKFADYLKQAEEMERVIDDYVVTDVSQVDKMQKAQKAQKALQRIRLDAEITRKDLKAEYLNGGRLVDGINNVILGLVSPMEAKMNASSKFIEIAEQKKRDEVRKARVDALSPYTPDAAIMPVMDMTDEGFAQMLATFKAGHEKRLADAVEVERKRKEEDDRLAKENETLKVFHARYKELILLGAVEHDHVVTLRNPFNAASANVTVDHILEAENAEWAEVLTKFNGMASSIAIDRKADQKKKDDEKAKTEAKLKKEKEERIRLEKEASDKQAEEDRKKKDDANAKRRATRAPDREKATALMQTLSDFRDKNLPKMSTPEGQLIIRDVTEMFNRMVIYVDKKVKNLDE